MNWKDELELRAMQVQAGTVRYIPDSEIDDRRSETGRMIRQALLEHRLRRSERWADTLFWITVALLFGNIWLLLALLN